MDQPTSRSLPSPPPPPRPLPVHFHCHRTRNKVRLPQNQKVLPLSIPPAMEKVRELDTLVFDGRVGWWDEGAQDGPDAHFLLQLTYRFPPLCVSADGTQLATRPPSPDRKRQRTSMRPPADEWFGRTISSRGIRGGVHPHPNLLKFSCSKKVYSNQSLTITPSPRVPTSNYLDFHFAPPHCPFTSPC